MLSVIIITKNEAANLKYCLEALTWVDEIIVLDSGSTDETCAIAREFTPLVYVNEDWMGYGIQKQRALSYARGDWVLNLDADEVVSDELKNQIQQAMQIPHVDAYRIPIRMYFYGKALRFSSSPKRHVRLFKRDGAHFSTDNVHKKIILSRSARIAKLKAPICHHSFRDLNHALTKMNRYSSCSAGIRLAEQQGMSFPRALANTAWMFFRCFIVQRGFLDGKPGFLMAFLNAEGAFYRGMKQLYPDV